MAEKIGVWSAAAVGLGAIIGAGIFVLSGTVIALAGVWSLLAFVIVGVLALIIALEIGELGSIMPNTKGATYSYIYGAFGSEMGFISGILMFVSYSTATAVISDGFGAYLSGLLGLGSSSVWVTVFALLL
ncbi:MAG: amino acid permease, partial [Candidatus Micrarchaeota archaeon]|nr:amino acid permease [Candidatus Micrarchaeota archaeon]